MSTQVNPAPVEKTTIRRQKTVTSLETLDDVLLFKETEFVPVKSTQEALERLGNDASKFLAIVNEGLENETARAMMSDDSIPYFSEDEEGNKTPFTGDVADSSLVNPLILNLAKTVFGYPSGEKGEAARAKKQAARASAVALVKSTPAILEGIKSQAKGK